MSTPFHPALAPLVGSWRLCSARTTFTDTGEVWETWGPHPEGHMMLDPGGRIIFLFTKPNRQPPTHDTERATLFTELLAYTGLVRYDGPGRFITTVDVAKHPAEVGTEKLRLFTLEGDRLIISIPEQVTTFTQGRLAVSEMVFVREQAANLA